MKPASSSARAAGKPFVLLRQGESAARAGVAPRPGRVSLVGAGPGDPDLLTLKAARRIAEAEVLVHDGLVPAAILALAKPSARRISVAKRKARHSVAQAGIEALLIALARDGFDVVRLKGGDPFIFGRGGEEVDACRAAGVACEVVPGVTAASAAAAGAGIPLTHRGLARTVTLLSGHDPADPGLDWMALAASGQTLAIYMGLGTAGELADRLIAAGRAPVTPALIVENASLANERRVATSLASLGQATAGLEGPAVLILGEVAAMAAVRSADAEPAAGWTPAARRAAS